MWCKTCNQETSATICNNCGELTVSKPPMAVFWCKHCNIPIIKSQADSEKEICPSCVGTTTYMTTDLRPVFPEERLLLELIKEKPLAYLGKSVWASNNRYYINGKIASISNSLYNKLPINSIREQLTTFIQKNNYDFFNENVEAFCKANKKHLNLLINEAHGFIKNTASTYPIENVVISFSGGKDSTVTADLTVRALRQPSLVHIYGDTTLELDATHEYVERYKASNPKTIFKTAINREQNFFKVCDDIGPPARMLRWCCYMFKTGPITRVINNTFRNENILTFYGIRKHESVARSKYNRIEDNAETVKILKQKVAAPIFEWKDIDVWLYILSEKIDFNKAYRLGYDRVGCWCCPNNNERAQFLAKLFMPQTYDKWRDFLIDFAKKVGKPDPEIYVDSGAWKARQGGNGLIAASDVKIKFSNCTNEENAKIYRLNKPIDENFLTLFVPFGILAPELGRKLIKETIVVDRKTKVPILSIQPFNYDNYEHAVKIRVMNVTKTNIVHRQLSYQVKKWNACRQCLKCESICRFGAITITNNIYHINQDKCTGCKMCVTAKYLEGGCLMEKYLKTKVEG